MDFCSLINDKSDYPYGFGMSKREYIKKYRINLAILTILTVAGLSIGVTLFIKHYDKFYEGNCRVINSTIYTDEICDINIGCVDEYTLSCLFQGIEPPIYEFKESHNLYETYDYDDVLQEQVNKCTYNNSYYCYVNTNSGHMRFKKESGRSIPAIIIITISVCVGFLSLWLSLHCCKYSDYVEAIAQEDKKQEDREKSTIDNMKTQISNIQDESKKLKEENDAIKAEYQRLKNQLNSTTSLLGDGHPPSYNSIIIDKSINS